MGYSLKSSIRIAFAVALAAILVIVCAFPGCGTSYAERTSKSTIVAAKERAAKLLGLDAPPPTEASHPATAEPTAAESMKRTARRVLLPVIWIAGVSAVLSLVLGFFLPIPKTATAGAIAGFVGGLALLYAVERYGPIFAEVAVWSTVALGIAAGAPWVVAFLKTNLARANAAKGRALAIAGHVDAGVAFLAESHPKLLDARKDLLAKVTAALGSPDLDTREELIDAAVAELKGTKLGAWISKLKGATP